MTPDLFSGPSALPPVSIADQVRCLQRELEYRRRVYPRWIDAGKVKPEAAAERLKQCVIHCRPALEMIDLFAELPDAVLYLDPPYPRATINTYSKVYRHDMADDDHRRLAERLRTARCGVILSMAEGTVYDDVLRDWPALSVTVRGMQNGNRREVIRLGNIRRDLLGWAVA